MIKGAISLAAAVVLSLVAYCVYFYCATRPVQAMMNQPEAEMEWLRREFSVSDAQFEKIKARHAAYRPTCEEMCRKIVDANGRLDQAIQSSTTMTAEVDAALRRATEVQQECRQAMLAHIYSVSAEMNPKSARRYLEMMKARITQAALPPDTAVSRSTSD